MTRQEKIASEDSSPMLESLVRTMGSNPATGGRLFVLLSARLLDAMGFEEIHIRQAPENGRDIDAVLENQTWFFECKRYSGKVSTTETAYKFMQVEMLPQATQPQHFVILSNAPLTSILKDIIDHKNVSEGISYAAHAWCNEPLNPIFNNLLLSYPHTYLQFLHEQAIPFTPLQEREFFDRSSRYLAERSPFAASARRHKEVSKQAKLPSALEFVIENCVSASRQAAGYNAMLLTVACPLNPTAGLYNPYSPRKTEILLHACRKWGVRLTERNPNWMRFRESISGTTTIVFEFGAFVIATDLLGLDHMPSNTWLQALREDSLRIRNFAKAQLIQVPFVLQSYLFGSGMPEDPIERRAFSVSDLYAHSKSSLAAHHRVVDYAAESMKLIFSSAPDTHSEIGRVLAPSMWKQIGFEEDLVDHAYRASDFYISLMRNPKTSPQTVRMAMTQATIASGSVDWFVKGELYSRGYEVFEGFLNSPDPEQEPLL